MIVALVRDVIITGNCQRIRCSAIIVITVTAIIVAVCVEIVVRPDGVRDPYASVSGVLEKSGGVSVGVGSVVLLSLAEIFRGAGGTSAPVLGRGTSHGTATFSLTASRAAETQRSMT